MTKKERLKKYLEVYENIANGKEDFMCLALTRYPTVDSYAYGPTDPFTEFVLFAPSKKILKKGFNWTDSFTNSPYSSDARNFRLTVLAFCIAMCQYDSQAINSTNPEIFHHLKSTHMTTANTISLVGAIITVLLLSYMDSRRLRKLTRKVEELDRIMSKELMDHEASHTVIYKRRGRYINYLQLLLDRHGCKYLSELEHSDQEDLESFNKLWHTPQRKPRQNET